MSARPLPDFHAALLHELGLMQGIFHLLGTAILCGLLLVLRLPAPIDPATAWRISARSAAPTLALLGFALVLWLQWALRQFPTGDSIVLFGGLLGGAAGLILPVVSVAWLARRNRRSARPELAGAEPGSRVATLYSLYAMTWVWSLTFALGQFLIGVAA